MVSAQSQHSQCTAATDNQGKFSLRMPVEAITLTVSGPSIADFRQAKNRIKNIGGRLYSQIFTCRNWWPARRRRFRGGVI
jgi:hypothetical protein